MKSNQPLVSIIIPAYNEAKHIARAIKSAQHQDMHDIEIIVVDDGSTDKTPNIVSKLAQKDSRIKLYSLDCNQGTFNARLHGINNAVGKYISFLDADDTIDTDTISSLVAVAQETDADIVEMGYKVNCIFHKINVYAPNRSLEIHKFSDILINKKISPSMCSKIYRRGLITSCNLVPYRCSYGEDFIFNIQLMNYVNKFAVLEEQKYNYNLGNTGFDCLLRWNDIKILYQLISSLSQIKENPQYANIITKNLYDDLIGNIALQLFNPFKSIQSIKKWLTTEINSIFWHDISKRLSPQINLNDINMLISHGKQRLKAERKNYFIYLITSIFKQ